jgi:hypothetical protein
VIPVKILTCPYLQNIIIKTAAQLLRIWTSLTYSVDKEVFTGLAVEASMCACLVGRMDKNVPRTGHSGSKGMSSAKYDKDLDKESMDMTTMFNSQCWDCWRKVILVRFVFSWGKLERKSDIAAHNIYIHIIYNIIYIYILIYIYIHNPRQ